LYERSQAFGLERDVGAADCFGGEND